MNEKAQAAAAESSPVCTTEGVKVRVHGPESLPTLVYLPGLHGNWTLIAGFRKALAQRLRFVEISYPPTLTWSLVK